MRQNITKIFAGAALMVSVVLGASASGQSTQKGVDPQTQRIKQDANRTIPTADASGRSIDWGAGKTETRAFLANPYPFRSRRDVLVNSVVEALKERKIIIDEAASRPAEGLIITQPFVFAKGAVITRSELAKYAVLQSSDTAWLRGQYTLVIEVQPVDGTTQNVSVNAKVEGRSGNGLTSEWTTLQSSGTAEDDFLAKLVELVTGNPPERVVDNTDQ